MTHTPGPWHVGNGSSDDLYRGDDTIIAKRGESNIILCQVNNFVDGYQSNSRIIAAALELLDALDGAMFSLGMYMIKDMGVKKFEEYIKNNPDCTINQAKAAIARAKGE